MAAHRYCRLLRLARVRTSSHGVDQEAADKPDMLRLSTKTPFQLYGQARHVLRLWALSLLLLGLPDGVQATIYSCSTGNGGIVFQDIPCPMTPRKNKPVPKKHRLPFDIHESWFELPGQAEGRAYCDRRRCECGDMQRKLDGSLDRAVADALYMDGGWHRYETSYQLWIDSPASAASTPDLRDQMVEDACNVMISQQLLRKYGNEVRSRLRQKVLVAEERGFDQPEPCNAGINEACSYLNAVKLYQHMLADARALKTSRDINADVAALPLNR